jgi:alpha-galactosidase
LISTGDYYRLTSTDQRYIAWQFVSKDKNRSLAICVQKENHIDYKPIIQKFYGLNADAKYQIVIDGVKQETLYSGISLMEIGIRIRNIKYECESTRIEILAAN